MRKQDSWLRTRCSVLGETSQPVAGNKSVQRKGRKGEEKVRKEIWKQEIVD